MKTCADCPLRDGCRSPCDFLRKELKKVTSKRGNFVLVPADTVANQPIKEQGYPLLISEMEQSIELGDDEVAILNECDLTDRQREVIYRHFWEHQNYEEIGKALDISRWTVQRDLESGLSILHDYILELLSN